MGELGEHSSEMAARAEARCVPAGAGGHPHVHEAVPGRDRRGAAARPGLPAVPAVRRGAGARRFGAGEVGGGRPSALGVPPGVVGQRGLL